MFRLGSLVLTITAAVFVAGCSDAPPPAATGGASGTGGSGGSATESGGATGSGGEASETGGAVGTGGEAAHSGGTTGAGGEAPETGGAPGSGGEAAGSGGETSDATGPTDTSQAGIDAFLAAGSYKSAPWLGDSAVRTPTSSTNVHGDVRVYYNPTAVTSRENGQNELGHDTGNSLNSMVVKELYDGTGTQIGTAVMLRVTETGTDDDWLYYCKSTAGGCASMTDGGPHHGTGLDDCRFCHGGLFIGPLP